MARIGLGPRARTTVVACLTASLLAGCAGEPPIPPSTLAPGRPIAIQNPGFVPDAAGRLPGWEAVEHNTGQSYTFVADTEFKVSEPASLRIRRHGKEIFGAMQQRLRAQPDWSGKTVRLSGYVRSAGIDGAGGMLVLQTRDGSDYVIHTTQTGASPIRGDTPWRHVAVELKVAPNTWWLQVGVLLEEGGTLWADDLVLEIVD